MEAIIDTNKVLSAIIRSGKVRKIFVFSSFKFHTPKYILNEINKHRRRICAKVGILLEDFEFILNELILPAIFVVEDEIYRDRIDEAKEIARQFDYKDYPFIALALKLNVSIWTNDKAMIVYGLKSGRYLALDTNAIEDFVI